MISRTLLIAGLSGLMALPVVTLAPAADRPTDPEDAAPTDAVYAARGADSCLRCHDQPPATLVLHGPHAVRGDPRTPFAQHDCEGCHGPSASHMGAVGPGRMRPLPAVVFSGPNASPVAERNAVCLTCHQSGLRMTWQSGQHATSDTACVDCHRGHTRRDPVLVKRSQPQVCFACHQDRRADSIKLSHHPIREGKTACSDCHNPHGSPGQAMLRENTVNRTCYLCHAEKRGPFMWEHLPVRESCVNCHDPHGSPQFRLLHQRPPFLCQNCHDRRHNSNPFSGNNLIGANNNPAPPSSAAAAAAGVRAFGVMNSIMLSPRSCLNCHSNIHGSNSPSGRRFLR